jgi:hypothetical protein
MPLSKRALRRYEKIQDDDLRAARINEIFQEEIRNGTERKDDWWTYPEGVISEVLRYDRILQKREKEMNKYLLPCPFCGGAAWLSRRRGWPSIACVNIKCAVSPETPNYECDESAIEAWNTRTPAKRG